MAKIQARHMCVETPCQTILLGIQSIQEKSVPEMYRDLNCTIVSLQTHLHPPSPPPYHYHHHHHLTTAVHYHPSQPPLIAPNHTHLTYLYHNQPIYQLICSSVRSYIHAHQDHVKAGTKVFTEVSTLLERGQHDDLLG